MVNVVSPMGGVGDDKSTDESDELSVGGVSGYSLILELGVEDGAGM